MTYKSLCVRVCLRNSRSSGKSIQQMNVAHSISHVFLGSRRRDAKDEDMEIADGMKLQPQWLETSSKSGYTPVMTVRVCELENGHRNS